MPEETKKKCFIITPIGPENSETRRLADGVIESVIQPVLESDFAFQVEVAHKMDSPGSISNQIISHLLEDDLVVANLTELNPNVMYELAVRHAVRKDVIHICETGTPLPFDVKDERTIYYINDMKGVVELKRKFHAAVTSVLEANQTPDNPIYRAARYESVIQQVNVNEPALALQLEIMDRLVRMEALLSKQASQRGGERPGRSSYMVYFAVNLSKIDTSMLQREILKVFRDAHVSLEDILIPVDQEDGALEVVLVIDGYISAQGVRAVLRKLEFEGIELAAVRSLS